MIASFILGFIVGMFVLALLQTEAAKKYDLTVINGKVKWVKRSDKLTMDYSELKEKYK